MIGPLPLEDYNREIRSCVCSHCVERLPGAPPCMEQGKVCGIEAHLPDLLGAVHQTYAGVMDPYIESVKCLVCAGCAAKGSFECPCPMDYLLPLLVEAVETIDERREEAGPASGAEVQP